MRVVVVNYAWPPVYTDPNAWLADFDRNSRFLEALVRHGASSVAFVIGFGDEARRSTESPDAFMQR